MPRTININGKETLVLSNEELEKLEELEARIRKEQGEKNFDALRVAEIQRDLLIADNNKALFEAVWGCGPNKTELFLPLVKAAMEAGADVNAINKNGMTPLMAVRTPEVAKLLIEAGADVNAIDKEGRTTLMWGIDRIEMDGARNAEVAKLLIEAGADVNAIDKEGRTTLMWGIKNAEVTKLLIEAGADVNAPDNKDILFYAVKRDGVKYAFSSIVNRSVDQVRLLIEAGADVNAINKNGMTPLMYARTAEVAKLLIEAGADVNARDLYGRTPLMYVDVENVAKLLIEAGADVNVRSPEGWTPLMHAVSYEGGNIDLVKLLIKAGADVNAKSNDGRCITSMCRDDEIMLELVLAGAPSPQQGAEEIKINSYQKALWTKERMAIEKEAKRAEIKEQLERLIADVNRATKALSGVVIADKIAEKKLSGEINGDITPDKGKQLRTQIMSEINGRK